VIARWVMVAAVTALGCGSSPRVIDQPITRTAPAPSDAHAAAVAEAEAAFADRLDETRLRTAIDAWSRAIALRDTDVGAYVGLARAWCFLADGHLAFDPARKDEIKRAYETAAAYAERGLRALSSTFERRRRAGEDVDAAARDLPATAAPLLYWWALCVIRWADLDGWTTAAGIYQQVFRVMERVRLLDETVDHAGPDRFFGAARAESPAIAGGSLTESRRFFDRAVELDPDYLETHLQIARTLARRSGDRELFEAARRRIAETPADRVSDAVPEQEVARRKARALTW
jgi:hypothetical protein